jgi:hypothetical protein
LRRQRWSVVAAWSRGRPGWEFRRRVATDNPTDHNPTHGFIIMLVSSEDAASLRQTTDCGERDLFRTLRLIGKITHPVAAAKELQIGSALRFR